MTTHFEVLGMMSGTSLDGMDLAYCIFDLENDTWSYKIKIAETIPYDQTWKEKLHNAIHLSGLELSLLHVDYGHFIGESIKNFNEKHNLKPDFVSAHGHTIFHQPERYLTLQIGDGAAIAAKAECTVVNQFRNTDVALGGQGAPLVPIGDKLLFVHADFCLNLGGIANISYESGKTRYAFDISPCNMAINYLCNKIGLDYDKDGDTAKKGTLDNNLLEKFNILEYYHSKGPKSLAVEWFNTSFKPLLDDENIQIEDYLRTVYEHIAIQISKVINSLSKLHTTRVLISGGGAKNKFLISLINEKLPNSELIEINDTIIDFKEALVFAFLGVLRIRNEVNCLASVTGASYDNIGGAVYYHKN